MGCFLMKTRTKNLLRTLLCLFAFASATALAETLIVAVAPNVKFAFDDLQAEFKKASGIDIKPVIAASGALTSQIKNGAPFDVFVSADMGFPEEVFKSGFATAPPKQYASGILVLWTAKALDLSDWKSLLTDKRVRKIAIPNPKTAPYGREAMKLLTHLKLDETLKAKLVFAESISQSATYVLAGVVDVGFNAKSVAASMPGKGKWVEIRDAPVEPIPQGAVILKHGQMNAPDAAAKFFDFLFSPKARAIFAAHGYLVP